MGERQGTAGGDFRWDSILSVTKESNPVTAGFITSYAYKTAFFSLLVQLAEVVRLAAFLFQFNTI